MSTTMTIGKTLASAIALGSLAAWAAQAQERIAVPLTDASRPAVLEVNALRTVVKISAYDGKDVRDRGA